MVRVHSGLPYPLAAPVVLPTVRCGGPEGPGIPRHDIQRGVVTNRGVYVMLLPICSYA